MTDFKKQKKILSRCNQTQKNVLFYHLDEMFRSIDHHQAIFTKLRARCMQRH
jgi:hypothetical protein